MKSNHVDEADLVAQLVAGDRAAFEQVFLRHNAAMIRLATGIVKSQATAEEVVQDCWVSVLKNIGGFERRSSLAGWIFTILLNTARSRAKRDGRTVSFDADGPDNNLAAAFDGRGHWKNMPDLWEELTPERIVAGQSVMEHVTAAIEALPPGQKAVLILRAHKDLETQEVCAILSITEGNMRVLLHRARLAVRAALDRVL